MPQKLCVYQRERLGVRERENWAGKEKEGERDRKRQETKRNMYAGEAENTLLPQNLISTYNSTFLYQSFKSSCEQKILKLTEKSIL